MRRNRGSIARRALIPAAASLLAAGLLWGALSDRGAGLPEGWEPVNERVAEELAESGNGEAANVAGGAQDGSAERRPAASVADEAAAGDTVLAGEAVDSTSADGGGLTEAVDTAESGGGETTTASAAEDGRLDLNAASAAELDALPGIGPAKSLAIVADRQANGPYRSVDELTRVKGIGDKMLDKLRPYVKTVD